MSATDPKAIVQAVASLYPNLYCSYAAFALLAYDWSLCLVQEVRLIWNWHSGITSTSLVYVLSRYTWLVQALLSVATTYLTSIQSCAANGWAQVAVITLGTAAFGAFSALRAYALSNKSVWLTTIISLLALPPTGMRIVTGVDRTYQELPSPLNCRFSISPHTTVLISARDIWLVLRISQLVAELLVISITWWYTYYWQLYNVWSRSGINYGASFSSFLIHNGSIYFLFLATMYLIDIILTMTPLRDAALQMGLLLEAFYEPITSILVCRFILSLRQFDTTISSGSATYPGLDSQLRDYRASTVLQFATQPGDTLSAFIAPFAHPVHSDFSTTVDDGPEWRDADAVASPIPETSSCQSLGAGECPSDLECSA